MTRHRRPRAGRRTPRRESRDLLSLRPYASLTGRTGWVIPAGRVCRVGGPPRVRCRMYPRCATRTSAATSHRWRRLLVERVGDQQAMDRKISGTVGGASHEKLVGGGHRDVGSGPLHEQDTHRLLEGATTGVAKVKGGIVSGSQPDKGDGVSHDPDGASVPAPAPLDHLVICNRSQSPCR